MFKTVSRPVVGLDVGSRAVKMVGLRKNGDGYHVTAAVLSNINSDGESKTPSQIAVAAAIEDCFRSSKGRISRNGHFVLGLSGPMVKVSSFNFASLTIDEVAQAVMFEAAQVCPFDIRTSVVDYQLIDSDDVNSRKNRKNIIPNVKGILAVAANEEISKTQKLAKNALLKCVLMDSNGLAILNCLKESPTANKKLPVAVIDVGASLTTVTILGDDGLPFIRDLNHSGNDIIAGIAKGSGISADQVQLQLSRGDSTAPIAQACRKLVHDINETLSYYSIQNGSDPVNHVYVCGGFSLVDSFVKVLNESINCDVSLWNPLSDMTCYNNIAASELISKCGPALAVAAGLAMRQI